MKNTKALAPFMGAVLLGTVALSGCTSTTENYYTTGADGKTTQMQCQSSNDCQVVRAELQKQLQTKVSELVQSNTALQTAVNAKGSQGLTMPSQAAVNEANTDTIAANNQLPIVLGAPTIPQFIDQARVLDLLVDGATDAQNDAADLAGKDLGVDLNAVVDAATNVQGKAQPNVEAALKATADLNTKIQDLQSNAGLTADVKSSLSNLSGRVNVLADLLNDKNSVDSKALLNANGDVQLMLRNLEPVLADVNAKVNGKLGADGVKGLNLDGAAALKGLVKVAAPVVPAGNNVTKPVNSGTNAAVDAAAKVKPTTGVVPNATTTVNGTVNSTVPAKPAVTVPPVNVDVNGTVDTTVHNAADAVNTNVNGTVNSTVNGVLDTTTKVTGGLGL